MGGGGGGGGSDWLVYGPFIYVSFGESMFWGVIHREGGSTSLSGGPLEAWAIVYAHRMYMRLMPDEIPLASYHCSVAAAK